MNEKEAGAGFNKKMDGKLVAFLRDIEKARNPDGNLVKVDMPKGTVGALTGGFSTKGQKGKLVTLYDVEVCFHSGSHKRILYLVSVPIEDLNFLEDEDVKETN